MASLDAVLPLLSPHSHNFGEWETILKQRLCPLFPYIGSAILKNAVPSTRFANEPHTRDFIFDDLFADVPTFLVTLVTRLNTTQPLLSDPALLPLMRLPLPPTSHVVCDLEPPLRNRKCIK